MMTMANATKCARNHWLCDVLFLRSSLRPNERMHEPESEGEKEKSIDNNSNGLSVEYIERVKIVRIIFIIWHFLRTEKLTENDLSHSLVRWMDRDKRKTTILTINEIDTDLLAFKTRINETDVDGASERMRLSERTLTLCRDSMAPICCFAVVICECMSACSCAYVSHFVWSVRH